MPSRRGYTLFEMVIVVALIVLLSGLAIPSIESMYADYKLQSAVDQVGGKWALARTRAVTDGRPYRFSVGPGGDSFRVAPDDSQFWGGDAPPAADGTVTPLVVEDSLPRGIQFAVPDTTDPNTTDPSGAGQPAPSAVPNSSATGSGSGWNTVAVFLPDGTAQQDVEIVFRMPNCAPVSLCLRALTGGVSSRRLGADGSVR